MINFYNYYNGVLDCHDRYNASLMLCNVQGFKSNPSYDYSPILHIIKRDPGKSYLYAFYIKHGRWLEIQPTILTSTGSAILYATHVIGGRWPELEPLIMQSPHHAYYYAYFVLKARWVEAEPYIKNELYWYTQYEQRFDVLRHLNREGEVFSISR